VRNLRITLLLCVLFVPRLSAQSRDAWWVDATFKAAETSIELIPVRDLDRSWVAASPLRESDLSPEAALPGESLKDHQAAFELEGDFNGDGKGDKALVGVYRTAAGEEGAFLLLLKEDTRRRWVKNRLFKAAGADFTALVAKGNDLTWVFCFECDGYCSVERRWWRGWRVDCGEEPDA